MSVTIEGNGVRLDLDSIGEGFCGDYDPDDPTDRELLRFDVYKWAGPDSDYHDNWEPLDDASYCTQIPADLDAGEQAKLAAILFNEVFGPVNDGHSIKKLCERLSWIGTDGAFLS